MSSTKKGDFFRRQILFNAEKVHMELGDGSVVPILLQYDSWASDSSINAKLAGGLKDLQHEGNLLIQQFATVVEQPNTYTGLVKLKEMNEELRCMVSQQEPQNVNSKVVNVPNIWREEHGLSDQFVSEGGEILLVIGMDNYRLFPRFIDGQEDLVLSRSVITNNIIVGGKTQKKQSDSRPTVGGGWNSTPPPPGWVGSPNNSTVASTVEEEEQSSGSVIQENLKEDENKTTQCRTVTCGDPDTDTLLKFLSSTEIPNPLKRCGRCKSCDQCKKSYLPDQEKNETMLEIIKKNVTYDEIEECYQANYIYNENLKSLPTYKSDVLRMQKNLERKLINANKAQQFNDQVEDFFSRKVLVWVPEDEPASQQQESHIPLTYAEKEQSSTALRICGNSSFTSGGRPSFNETQIPGPNCMASLLGCILKFRTAYSVALGDISKMFHRIKTDEKSNNLRRVWIREQGMGSNSRWRIARFCRMSFGDINAPAFAIVVLALCIMTFVLNEVLRKRIIDSTYMDDIQIPILSKEEDVDEFIQQTEAGLKKGGFSVKSWIKTGQDVAPQKYLCYDYYPKDDKIKLRLRFNMSKKRRGMRLEADIPDYDEFENYVKQRSLTKRNLASLLAGCVFDPLCLAAPYLANLKIAYRRVCRQIDKWDEFIPIAEQEIVCKTVKHLFAVNDILMPRSAFVHGADAYKLRFFWDASDDINNVSVSVSSILPQGKVVDRILMNKLKLNPSGASSIPRKELAGGHLAARMKEVIIFHLKDFLDSLNVPWSIEVLSDSMIVLAQINSLPFYYKPWVACRLAEIQELLPKSDPIITFKHVKSEHNLADISTRLFFESPEYIPWFNGDLIIDESYHTVPVGGKISDLPDVKRSEMSIQNMV